MESHSVEYSGPGPCLRRRGNSNTRPASASNQGTATAVMTTTAMAAPTSWTIYMCTISGFLQRQCFILELTQFVQNCFNRERNATNAHHSQEIFLDLTRGRPPCSLDVCVAGPYTQMSIHGPSQQFTKPPALHPTYQPASDHHHNSQQQQQQQGGQ